MDKEDIYIDSDENIQSVIRKIEEAESDNLNLVAPAGARVLKNIVDAHLLKEAGMRAGKTLNVVTSDLMGKIVAERAGLIVARQDSWDSGAIIATAAVSGRISDIVPRSRRANAPLGKNIQKGNVQSSFKVKVAAGKSKGVAVDTSKDSAKKGNIGASFLKAYREERAKSGVFDDLRRVNHKRLRSPLKLSVSSFVGLIVAVAVVAGAVAFSRALPKAEILIYPARDAKSSIVEISISSKDAGADFEKGIIPGELLVLEKSESGEFAATAVKDVSEKARGMITISNEFSSASQALIPSRFQSEGGKIFWTTKTINVPGASIKDGKTTPGQIQAEVIASEPGEDYNIASGRFSMPAFKNTPKANKIYAVSDVPMSGGKIGRAKVVSSENVNSAFGALKEKTKQQLQALRQNLPAGFQFWPEAYNEELAESSTIPNLGESAESFKATVKMVARAIIFKKQDLENYIDQQINRDLEEGKILLPSSKEISFFKSPVVDYQKGSIVSTLSVKYDVISQFDTVSFKAAILGKKKDEITKILEDNYKGLYERADAKFSPSWMMNGVPTNAERVEIKIIGL